MAQNHAPRRLKPEVMAIKFVQAMDRTEDAVFVKSAIQDIIEKLGFTSVICARLPTAGRLDRDCILLSTQPEAWTERYFARGYDRYDPILRAVSRSRHAFAWPDDLGGRALTRREREVLRQAAGFGMPFGFTVPIPEAGFATIAGSRPCTDERLKSALTLIAIYIFHKLRALAAARRRAEKRLSPREIEVLRWVKEGKSDWQIGRILSISAKTVNYHTENAKRKFGVATRMQAVVSAIERGELSQ